MKLYPGQGNQSLNKYTVGETVAQHVSRALKSSVKMTELLNRNQIRTVRNNFSGGLEAVVTSAPFK